jgi:tetratricopeptide (TPR) repeat protein
MKNQSLKYIVQVGLVGILIIISSFTHGQDIDTFNYDSLETQLMLKDLSREEKANTHLILGKAEHNRGNTLRSFEHVIKSIEISESLNNSIGVSKGYYALCNVYMDIQRWDKAIEYGLKSLKQKGALSSMEQFKLLKYLSVSYSRLNITDNALKYAQRLRSYCEPSDLNCEVNAYYIMALIHGEAGNHDSSIVYSQLALTLLQDKKSDLRANIINNLGVTYKEQGAYEDALKAFFDAKKHNTASGKYYFESVTLLNIGLVETIQKDYDSAFVHTKIALKGILKSPNKMFLKDCYFNLAEISENLEKSEDALHYYKAYQEALVESGEQDMRSNIAKLKLENQLVLAEEKGKSALRKTQNRQKWTNLIWGTSFIVLILMLIITILTLKRRKTKHALDRLLLENTQLNEKLLEDRISYTGGELSHLSAYLGVRNEFLSDLKEKIKVAKGLSIEKRNEMVTSINNFLQSDKEIQNSDSFVNETNQRIFFKLNQQGVKLGPKEEKFLFYILSDLSSKQISDLLNITPSSIDTARYRLRKKLDVPKSESIQGFLKKLINH